MIGGISSAAASQREALQALGYEVQLLLPDLCRDSFSEGFCWLRRPKSTLDHRRATRENAAAFEKAVAQFQPDLVWFSDACARLASRFDPKLLPPYVICVYGTELITPRPLATWISGRHAALRKALDGAALVLAVSQYTQSLLHQFHRGVPSQILYAPYDRTKVGPRPALAPSPFVGEGPHVVSVCRLAPRKNVAGALRIMARLRQDVPHLQFHIVGGGPERENLEAFVTAQGWNAWVHFYGRLPEEQLRNVYSHGDAYIMCSRPDRDGVEGLGLTYIEATMSGCLAIGTKHGGAAEVIRDGQTGLAIDPDDVEGAVQHILPWLRDSQAREALIAKGRQEFARQFGTETFQERVKTLLAERFA
jgi:glycosyltransferase involved in cell wall biosynthesis